MIRFVFASRAELQKRNSDLVSSQISVAASLYKMWHPPSLDPRLLVRKNSTKRPFQVPKRDDIRRWFILGLIQSMACIQRTERLSVCVWMAVFLTQFRRVSVLKLILFFVILGLKVPKSMQHFKKDRNAKRKKKNIFIKWQWVFKSHTKGKRCHAICKTHKTKDKSGAEQRSKFSEFISNQDISTAKKKK